MEFLFRDRGHGKRQVKVSQDVALLEDQFGAESSDDSEFKFDEDAADGDSGSSSSSSDGEDDNDSGSDSEAVDNQNADDEVQVLRHDKLTTQDLLNLCKRQLTSLDSSTVPESIGILPKICGCCLGDTSTDANEIVECDGCGIAVHEGCYGIGPGAAFVETGSVASTVSSASTEPWFCEPCRAGLRNPPSCELCPVVGGVYKETDVGRWVHLVCALYVPGVAFGDPEKLLNATLFEMNYASWGRRVCSLCSQEDVAPESDTPPDEDIYQLTGGARMCRTGVSIQCDAGMCKSFFHVTCAQAAGFLSEPAFMTALTMNPSHGGVVDSYLAHCKLHSDKTVIKQRRRAFLVQLAQTRKRRKDILDRQQAIRAFRERINSSKKSDYPDESPDERIWRKLMKQRERYNLDKAKNHDPWLPTQKMSRLLTTSASAIRKIQRLTSLSSGIDVSRQQTQEVHAISVVEAKKKWHLPPAFSVEFVAYYEDRHRRIEELKSKVNEHLNSHAKMKSEQTEVRSRFETVNSTNDAVAEKNKKLRQKIEMFRQVLGLGGTLPDASNVSALRSTSFGLPQGPDTPSVKARATVYSMNQQLKFLPQSTKVSFNVCGICKKSHDQHQLAHCDKCKLYYHLGCLTPPLTRMPKKSKLYGWACSECVPASSSADEELAVENTSDRKRKRRVAASKARFLSIVDAAGHFSGSDLENDSPPAKFPKQHSIKKSVGVSQIKVDAQPPPVKIEENDEDVKAAAAKAERKLLKKAEKERRKQEKKERKKNRMSNSDEVTIIEQPTLKTSPIRLKIKPIVAPQGANTSAVPTLDTSPNASNGHAIVIDLSDDQMSTSSSAKRRSSISSSGKRLSTSQRDVRSHCDKCDTPGTNADLVRCDECQRCFHFSCLIPPVRKSPKVAGYSWHCVDCDPSDQDSDWHLD